MNAQRANGPDGLKGTRYRLEGPRARLQRQPLFYFLARASTHFPSLWYMNVPHDLVAAATFVPLLFLDALAAFFLDFFLPAVSSTPDSIPGFAVGFL